MPGGFLGVDVFFVISGYLITSLLLGDWREHHHIRFGRFYLRRARRLLPALFLMMGGGRALRPALPPRHGRGASGPVDRRDLLRRELVPDLPQGLVLRRGRPAVDAAARLVARGRGAVLSLVAAHLRVPARALGSAAQQVARSRSSAASLASTVLMAVLYQPFTDPSRVYFGTDTRASTMLIGAALAIIWTPWRLHARHREERAARARRHVDRRCRRRRVVLPQRG